jgi:hypothetical protein
MTYLPPAARGDVEKASESFDAVFLIDGTFQHELAPTPKEVRHACRHTSFFGAASMGALRAAECRTFGAVPLGAIARWYARDVIDGDDEVAVLMHPTTYVALTVPSVNVRYVARLAVRRGLLHVAEAERWAHRARIEIHYTERGWTNAVALAPRAARAALHALALAAGDLKRLDARFALHRAVRLLERPDAA